jgi:iron-sulfur cluster repair protein YtfE (RIC family)
MSDDDAEKSLVDWVIDVPAAQAVFEEFNLDYSCAGKSLAYVCRQRGISLRLVLSKIRGAMESTCRNRAPADG